MLVTSGKAAQSRNVQGNLLHMDVDAAALLVQIQYAVEWNRYFIRLIENDVPPAHHISASALTVRAVRVACPEAQLAEQGISPFSKTYDRLAALGNGRNRLGRSPVRKISGVAADHE